MQRRTVIAALAGWCGSTALGGCTSGPAPKPPPPASASTSGAIPSATAPPGPFAVRTQKLRLSRGPGRPLPTTVWRPEATGRYPLILFSHGLTASPAGYATLLTAWARAGFVVAAPAYPHTSRGVADFAPVDILNQPADASHVITEVLSRLTDAVLPDRTAAAGHSAGGVTTLALFSTARDERLRAGVVLAGRQLVPKPFAGPPAPLLFVHGERDNTVLYRDGRAAFDALAWPKAFLTVSGGGHLATGPELDVIAATSTDFWRWTLYGDPAAKARIPHDATRGGLATLTDRL